MASRVTGVSLGSDVHEALDELASADGVSRSAMVARLVEAEVERRSKAGGRSGPVITVDGVRFVRARASKATR